jgi:hypothetical protein
VKTVCHAHKYILVHYIILMQYCVCTYCTYCLQWVLIFGTYSTFWPYFQDVGDARGLAPPLPHGDAEVGLALQLGVQQGALCVDAVPAFGNKTLPPLSLAGFKPLFRISFVGNNPVPLRSLVDYITPPLISSVRFRVPKLLGRFTMGTRIFIPQFKSQNFVCWVFNLT